MADAITLVAPAHEFMSIGVSVQRGTAAVPTTMGADHRAEQSMSGDITGLPNQAKEYMSSLIPGENNHPITHIFTILNLFLMKNLLFAFALLTLAACSKDEAVTQQKFCWKCTTRATVSFGNESSTSSTTTDYCNKTQNEIRDIEQAGTSTTTSSSGGVYVKTVTKTTCVKK